MAYEPTAQDAIDAYFAAIAHHYNVPSADVDWPILDNVKESVPSTFTIRTGGDIVIVRPVNLSSFARRRHASFFSARSRLAATISAGDFVLGADFAGCCAIATRGQTNPAAKTINIRLIRSPGFLAQCDGALKVVTFSLGRSPGIILP